MSRGSPLFGQAWLGALIIVVILYVFTGPDSIIPDYNSISKRALIEDVLPETGKAHKCLKEKLPEVTESF